MLLAVDVGNTNVVVGFMEGEEILATTRIGTNRDATYAEYAIFIKGIAEMAGIDLKEIDGAIISSVVPPVNHALSNAVKVLVGIEPMIVGAGVKTGVNILIDDPAEAGSDLIVASAAALKLYKPPMILIDLGTGTTVMVLDKNGAFRGGAIAPGMKLSLSALVSNTSLLPSISFDAPKHVIGTNTVDCLKSGSVLGTAYMIDGMIDAMEAEMGEKTTVVATGGLARHIVPICRHDIIVDDNLIFRGLGIIYEKNKRK